MSHANETPEKIIHRLREELESEKAKHRITIEELKRQRQHQVDLQLQVEVEEEHITNNLIKRINELKKEKQELALQIEREEEYLTNTLQKKLQTLQFEKVDLENKLEQEEEYIVNKLQKQLAELREEKCKLEKKLEEESRTPAGKSIQDLITEVRSLREKLFLKDKIITQQKQEVGKSREEVRVLKQDVFIWQQKVFREKEKLDSITQEKLQLEANREIDLENQYNRAVTSDAGNTKLKRLSTKLSPVHHSRERSLSSPVYPVFDENGNISGVTTNLSPTVRTTRSNSQTKAPAIDIFEVTKPL